MKLKFLKSISITGLVTTTITTGAVMGGYWCAKDNPTVKNVATGAGLGALYIATFPFSLILPKIFSR